MLKPIRKLLLIAVLACAGCTTVGSSLALQQDTWDQSCSGAMREYAFPLSGDSAVDCGFLALEAPDRDFYNIMDCAKYASASGKAYRFGYRNIDKFLSYCDVAVRSPDGRLWMLQFYVPIDEAMSRKPGLQYSFNAKQCQGLILKNDRRGFFMLDQCTEATDALMKELHQ